MGHDGTSRISLVIMHHPSRADRIPQLVRECAPLEARVVTDPDPTGAPSPLRTAKQAWAAVEPGATHHVVLQDDVQPCPNFAEHLEAAVAARPEVGIALYVNWNSPQNAYLLRKSVVAGLRWATLSPQEYTPTLGLVLPARHSHQLAAYLQELPDALRDDDEVISQFLRRQGLTILAAVPNLLDHGTGSSVAGNDDHGARHSALFAGEYPPRANSQQAVENGPPPSDGPSGEGSAPEFSLELSNSTCNIRFSRLGTAEPVDHLFGWYWQDWAGLIGADVQRIRDAWQCFAGAAAHVDDGCALEVWAAGFLLGADSVSFGRNAAEASLAQPADPDYLHGILESWIKSGLSVDDLSTRGEDGIAQLTEIAVVAVSQGLAAEDLTEAPVRLLMSTSGTSERVHA